MICNHSQITPRRKKADLDAGYTQNGEGKAEFTQQVNEHFPHSFCVQDAPNMRFQEKY